MNEDRERTTECCGHVFDTVQGRREHEAAVARGERVECPCGELCSEGAGE